MRQQLLRVTTDDDLILTGLISCPDIPTKKAVLHIHGSCGNFYDSKFFDPMMTQFPSQGWAFLSVNTRGHDYVDDIPRANQKEPLQIGQVYEIFEECLHDIKAWVDWLSSHGYTSIVLQGHSLGCSKIVYYLTQKKDTRINSLVLASPADMISHAEKQPQFKEQLATAQKMVTDGKSRDLLPYAMWNGFTMSAHTFLNFSVRDNPIDIFNTYDQAKPSLLNQVEIPILAFFGNKNETVIQPVEEALAIIEAKATQCPWFDKAIINGAPHSYYGHEDEVAALITNWLTKQDQSF